ncbi:MAG: hypothetical protein HQ488_01550 [Parcubacteria group bacterium]|nr:hypothetical protein [Parcubacteria group bacterium]
MAARQSHRTVVGGVPEDLRQARNFLAYLQLLTDAEEDEDFAGHSYDPGAFVPTDDSLLLVDAQEAPDEDELVQDYEEEEVAAADSVEDEIESDPDPEPAIEEPAAPAPEEEGGGELVELHQSAPHLSAVAAQATEASDDEDSDDEDVADEPSLSDLVAFARALSQSDPLSAGVETMALRRILRGLHADADLVEAIGMGDHERAKGLLASGHRTLRTLVVSMDSGMRKAQENPPATASANDVIISRLHDLIEQASASLAGLHEEIYRQAMTASTLVNAAIEAETTFEDRQSVLLAQISAVAGDVMLITRYHLARADSSAKRLENDTKRNTAIAQMRVKTESVDALHAAMLGAVETVRAKNELLQALHLKMRKPIKLAKDTLTKMRAQFSAAQILGAPIPQDLKERFRTLSEPVEMATQLWTNSSRAIELPEMSPEAVTALAQCEAHRATVISVISAPESLFTQRDSRESELRKLLMVTMLVIIPDKTQKTGSGDDVPHRGYKLNHFFEAMREAGLISKAECNDFDEIKDWARLGSTTKRDPRPKYIKGWGRGTTGKRWHSWNLRKEGQELAREHLATVSDVSGFSKTIKEAFKRVLPNYWND